MYKQLIVLCILLMPQLLVAQGSTPQKWKPFLVKDASLVKVTPAPSPTETKRELENIKTRIKNLDEKAKQQIIYWNAGAPSYRWNQIASKLNIFQNFAVFTRGPNAWMNIAIYDATLLARGMKNQNKRTRPSVMDASIKPFVNVPANSSYPCEHSVTAAAASTVLAYFFPEKADSIMKLAKQAADSRVNAGVQFPSDVEAGWKLGEQVAVMVIEQAKKDEANQPWNGIMRKDVGIWTGKYPVGYTMPQMKPIMIHSRDQFRPGPPPNFEADMKELREFKPDFRSKYMALRWAALSGVDYWNDVAGQKLFEYGMMDDALAASSVYTVMNIAVRDAGIVIMDAKYAYWGIRPFQYDSTYKPLIETPPFPGYPSGHATASSTMATVLSHFFPASAAEFEVAAKECADSRFYAGIHFQTDNMVGLEMGKKLGEFVVREWGKR